MRYRNAMIRSAISGVIWGAIAILMVMIVGGRFESLHRVAWGHRGGLLAAPLIGLMVGLSSRLFRERGLAGRILISLATLYTSAFLFMLASSLTALGAGELRQTSLSTAFFDSWNAAVAGITWTGFVVLLGPLAFWNHLWVSRGCVSSTPRSRVPDSTSRSRLGESSGR